MKKVLGLSLVLSMLVMSSFSLIEPAVSIAASAQDASTIITLNVDEGIAITNAADTAMSRHLDMSANTANASTTWNVKTNAVAGYVLSVNASRAPAMASASSSIADFAATPAAWSTLAASSAAFGFSVIGTDAITATYGTGSDCGAADVANGSLNYRGFASTTPINVATRAATTTTSGVDSTVCYVVEQKGMYVPSGTYTAIVTATAVTQ